MMLFVELCFQNDINHHPKMKANTLVEKFIYSCSHDLRSPVASILGLIRIADYYPHHEEIGKCLDMIEGCTYKLDNLIRKLEEYMVNNNQPLNETVIDPEDLMQKLTVQFTKQLDAYAIRLEGDVNLDVKWITDGDAIFKLLRYLIANSIAFYDPQKVDRKVVLRISTSELGNVIEVTDNGVGIPAHQRTKVFDVFFKASEMSIGAGMGLFLAKSLAEKMGGLISCDSLEGAGTTIRICFPK
jgi:signal transduction histidine kinase